MTATIGRIEYIVDADGRRLPAKLKQVGQEAAKSFDKGFQVEMDKFHNRFSDRFSKLGSELGTDMKRSGRLSGINFTNSMENVISGNIQRIADDVARAFGETGGLDEFARDFRSVDDAVVRMRRNLQQLHETGGLSERMWNRLGGTLNQWVGDARKVERATLEIDRQQEEARDSADRLRLALDELRSALGSRDNFHSYVRSVGDAETAQDRLTESLRRGREEGMLSDFQAQQLADRFDRIRSESTRSTSSVNRFNVAIAKSAESSKNADRGMFDWWKNMRTNGRQIVLISAAIAGGMEQMATLGMSLGPSVTVLGTSLGALGTGAGVAIAGFQGMLGEIDKIVPAARPVAAEMQKMGDAFTEMQDRIQAAMFDGLAPAFENVRTKLLPTLTSGFEGTATTINGIMQRLSDRLTSEEGLGRITKLLDGFNPILSDMSDGLISLGSALGGIFVAALPATQDFAREFSKLMDRFDKWISSVEGQNKLEEWFRDGMLVMGGLLDLVAELSKQFGELVTPESVNRTMDFLSSLTRAMDPLFSMFEALGRLDPFGIIAVALEQLLLIVQPVFDALAPLFEIIRNSFIMSMEVLGPILTILAEIVAGPLMLAFEAYNLVMSRVIEHMQPFIDLFGRASEIFTQVSEEIWTGIEPAINSIADAIIKLLPNQEEMTLFIETRVIPAIESFAAWIVNQAVPALESFAGWIENEAVPALESMWDFLFNTLIPVLADFIDEINKVVEEMGGWDSILSTLTTTGGGFISFSATVVRALTPVIGALSTVFGFIMDINQNAMRLLGILPQVRTPGGGGGGGGMASGGVVNFGARRLIGESGREAVVPLDRPLMQINPDVRLLAAFAQGKLNPGGRGATIESGAITVMSPAADPEMVASAVLDRVVAQLPG